MACADLGAGERVQFATPAFLQARAGSLQFLGAEAGMAHEFGDALGQLADQPRQFRRVIMPGDLKAGKMIGGAASVARQNAMKTGARESQSLADAPAAARARLPPWSGRSNGRRTQGI